MDRPLTFEDGSHRITEVTLPRRHIRMVRRPSFQAIAAAGNTAAENRLKHARSAGKTLQPVFVDGDAQNERRRLEKSVSLRIFVRQYQVEPLA